jgi:hypothetical protein
MLGNRVVAARSKRVAARDAANGKPASPRGSVTLERLDRVRGATRIITARGREQRRQRYLIGAYDEHEHLFHTFIDRSRIHLIADEPARERRHVRTHRADRRRVRLMTRTQHDVDRGMPLERGQELETDQLAHAPLELVARHVRPLLQRDDEAHSRTRERGSAHPDVEVRGPDSLPLSNDALKIGRPREAIAPRKTEPVRRPRTCSEDGR